MTNIALVTVNYNNSDATRALLNNLLECAVPYVSHIIVVDNASQHLDYSNIKYFLDQEWGAKPKPYLIRNHHNLGYFRGINSGLACLTGKPDKVVICNNDVHFSTDFFSTLASIGWESDVFVIAPDVVTADGIHQNPHAQRRLSLSRRLGYKLYFANYWLGISMLYLKRLVAGIREPTVRQSCEIYMGVGACYVLTSGFFARYERLDDRIFLWGEEALLANQLAEGDGKMIFEPTLKVTHSKSSTTHLIPRREQYEMAKKSYQVYRSYL